MAQPLTAPLSLWESAALVHLQLPYHERRARGEADRAMAQLERFRTAQNSPHSGFESALSEIRTGGKRGHWIWYIFPQLSGLGTSGLSQSFAIDSEEEAIEFLRDAELRDRFLTIASAVADQLRRGQGASVRALMGSDVDARKIVSSLTLFGDVARQMCHIEKNDAINSIAKVADEVLTAAASQGYPSCAYTLRRLQEMRSGFRLEGL